MTVLRSELDALLDRVREDRADTTGKNRNAVAYDCWRMFEDLATRFKEESTMRDRYKRQCNSWRDAALQMNDALSVAEAFIADELETRRSSFLPDPTEDEEGCLGTAQAALKSVRDAIAKAHGDRADSAASQIDGLRANEQGASGAFI